MKSMMLATTNRIGLFILGGMLIIYGWINVVEEPDKLTGRGIVAVLLMMVGAACIAKTIFGRRVARQR